MSDGELWLGVLQRICARASHEIRGALNGVSVNLEVVRSRAEKADVPASSVARYATVAADQLGAVMTMTEAVLVLSRPAADRIEIATVTRQIHSLLGPAARADQRRLELEEPFDLLGATMLPGHAARLAIGAALLSGIEQSTSVVCRADTDAQPQIVVESGDGAAITMDGAVVSAVGQHGIAIRPRPRGLAISFPHSRPTPSPFQPLAGGR